MGDDELPEPFSGIPAPVLGGLNSELTRPQFLEALTRPSHSFAPGFAPGADGLSPMRDYSEILTARQMADVIAYLEARQNDPDAEWPKITE